MTIKYFLNFAFSEFQFNILPNANGSCKVFKKLRGQMANAIIILPPFRTPMIVIYATIMYKKLKFLG